MSQKFSVAACLAIACIVITGIAWQSIPSGIQTKHHLQDTIPNEKKHRDKTVIKGDLDKALQQVEQAEERLNGQLQNGGLEKMHEELQKAQEKLNTINIHDQIEKAMKDIDLQKLQLEDQLKNIDVQRIQAETQAALQKVNWEKMQKDLEKAQGELRTSIDYKKIENDVRLSMEQAKKAMAELKNTDMEKIRQELDRSREDLRINEGKMQADLERAKKNLHENLTKDFKLDMEKAKEDLARTREQLKDYKTMLAEMLKDGLIVSEKEYNIKFNEGDLFINGALQAENITRKYQHYFKDKNVTLSKDKNDDNRVIDL